MPVTNYHTLNGELLGETGPGGRRFYGKDALGSVVATYDQNGTLENTYRYKPYGGLLSKTGSAPDPGFMWTGSTGSRATGASYAEQYNRARHYGSKQAGWTSVDPLWPQQPAYIYCGDSPALQVDPIGLCGNIQLAMPSPPSDPPKPKLSCNEHSLGERYCTYSTKFGNIGQNTVAYTIPKVALGLPLRALCLAAWLGACLGCAPVSENDTAPDPLVLVGTDGNPALGTDATSEYPENAWICSFSPWRVSQIESGGGEVLRVRTPPIGHDLAKTDVTVLLRRWPGTKAEITLVVSLLRRRGGIHAELKEGDTSLDHCNFSMLGKYSTGDAIRDRKLLPGATYTLISKEYSVLITILDARLMWGDAWTGYGLREAWLSYEVEQK